MTASAKAVETFTVSGWITDNAIIFGIVCTVLSLIMSLVFNLVNRMDAKRRAKEEIAMKAKFVHGFVKVRQTKKSKIYSNEQD